MPEILRRVTLEEPSKKAEKADKLQFVLSDETKDRYGDIIKSDGWQLANFKKNPIAMFNHDRDFPIGVWKSIKVEGKRLVATLKLAAEGTSQRIDEIRSLVEQGIIRATSVGFRALARSPILDDEGNPTGGIIFNSSELLEASLVSVPANPSALQLARNLNISRDTMALVFGEDAVSRQALLDSGYIAEQGARTQVKGNAGMTPIGKRIQDAQARLVALQDKARSMIDEHGDTPSDDQLKLQEAISEEIKLAKRHHETLLEMEKQLATATVEQPIERAAGTGGDGRQLQTSDNRRPFAMPIKKVLPRDYWYRSMAVAYLAHLTKRNPDEIRRSAYGDDEPTKVFTDLVTKAATAPATTTTVGWAAELVQTVIADFVETLPPQSIYPSLSSLGLKLGFGRAGIISVPTRSSTPTIAGSFVGEGAPIPVRQAAFTATTLTPKKMAVISSMTREISEHSIPAIEGLIRDAMQEDTAVAIDAVLIDTNAATTIRPAGIRNGVAAITAATVGASGTLGALVTDLTAMIGALITGSNGNLRKPVWIMGPAANLAISMIQNSMGLFPFQAEIDAGRLRGYPVIVSGSVAAGIVILVDAADFVSVTGDDPRFDVSDQATIHMEDTTPLAIGTVGSPNTVAAPTRSLWQTDSIGIRMILPMNWAMRRTGTVAWTQNVNWD